jgi:hypothetical protein
MTARVEVGFFSFTEVTDPSEHRSYNEWHQLDHLPQQYEIPGIVNGQRWVSTPRCSAQRAFSDDRYGDVHYTTLYLMSAPLEPTLEAFRALGDTLRRAGRFHRARRSHLSGPFGVVDAAVAPRALVSADVVPFRPNRGVYVVVDAPGGPDDAPSRLLRIPGVAGVWRFVSMGGFEHLGWHPGNRRVTVCYLDSDPAEAAATLGDEVRAIWKDTTPPELAGPFEVVEPWRWDWFDAPSGGGGS